MKIIKRRIRVELESGQWSMWMTDTEFRNYYAKRDSSNFKSVVIEETVSYIDAMKYLEIIK